MQTSTTMTLILPSLHDHPSSNHRTNINGPDQNQHIPTKPTSLCPPTSIALHSNLPLEVKNPQTDYTTYYSHYLSNANYNYPSSTKPKLHICRINTIWRELSSDIYGDTHRTTTPAIWLQQTTSFNILPIAILASKTPDDKGKKQTAKERQRSRQ